MTINTELVGKVLRAAFPDPNVQIGIEAVEAVVGAMATHWCPEFERHFGIPRGHVDASRPAPLDGDSRADFYLACATHTRHGSPGKHSFTAHLPVVRFTLPEIQEDVQTAAGWAYAGDRLLYSMTQVRVYLASQAEAGHPAPQFDRVDIVTPARMLGSRFGAFAVYLLIRRGRVVASILEGGMATGQPRVLYWMPTLGIGHVRRTWYEPTPDAKAHHYYRGTVFASEDGAHPDLATIERFLADPRRVAGQSPVITVSVAYEKLDAPACVAPGELLLQAACRVAAVLDAQGRQMPDVGLLTPVLAEIGRNAYTWHSPPEK